MAGIGVGAVEAADGDGGVSAAGLGLVGPAVAMADDGVAPDLVAGDAIYAAIIPGSAFSGGEMVRWRFLVEDTLDIHLFL